MKQTPKWSGSPASPIISEYVSHNIFSQIILSYKTGGIGTQADVIRPEKYLKSFLVPVGYQF